MTSIIPPIMKLMILVNDYLPEEFINTMAYWNMIDKLESVIDMEKLNKK